MKPAHCAYEEAVARAAQSGDWSAALRAHADQCKVSREASSVRKRDSAGRRRGFQCRVYICDPHHHHVCRRVRLYTGGNQVNFNRCLRRSVYDGEPPRWVKKVRSVVEHVLSTDDVQRVVLVKTAQAKFALQRVQV